MIKIILTSYKGPFRIQLDYISENAWIYNIKDLYIEGNFFQDWVDMKYYPVLLKKKEDINLHYIENSNEKLNYKNNDYSINDLVKYYNSDNNYYIDFYQLINDMNNDQQYLIQLINRYDFKKLDNIMDLKETVYVYQSQQYYYYFVINDTDNSLIHKNTCEKIIIFSKIKLSNNDNIIMDPTGFVIYYNKI